MVKYTGLLNSDNYVTKRQSLKVRSPRARARAHVRTPVRLTDAGRSVQLLGELLLDRTNFNIMTIYISNPDNLKLMMNLLRDSSRNIQFEAFHVFKARGPRKRGV
jgi:calcium binding protein 39